jgi:ATP-dependent helicase/nuclease subunit B
MPTTLHVLPWNRPLPAQAAAFLAEGWDGRGPLDLSRLLVVIPTRQSGRRLREALAEHAAVHGQAAFPPQVFTPDALIARDAPPAAASRLESLLAWAEVLRTVDFGTLRDVFPVDPPTRHFAWAARLAGSLVELQRNLAEAGLRIGDVGPRAGANFPEAERWRQLGELEGRYLAKLAESGRCDAEAAKIAAAQHPPLPAGVEKIILLATPDPLPLALTLLAAHARVLPVAIVVLGPPGAVGSFDSWGRPLPEVWQERELVLPEFERRVHLCADPAAQAVRIAALARAYGNPDGLLGVGSADSEVLLLLEGEFARAGLASFNPEGRPRRDEPLYHLLAALAELAREPAFDSVAALARCPDFLAFLEARSDGTFSAADWLGGLDQLRADHLPSDLAAARTHAAGTPGGPGLASALAAIDELRAMLADGAFADGVAAVLRKLFSSRQGEPGNVRLTEAAAEWMKVLRECDAARVHYPGLANAEWWDVALALYGAGRSADDKPAGVVELQGWLELLWEDAPHLVVAGLNDGCVPDAVAGDPFLPESLRERLGLKTNGARAARDAYLLQALAACRTQGGRLDLLLGKTSAAGDPLRPSRLLLRCADAALPRRIGFLFRPVEPVRTNLPWRRAWRLRPPAATAPVRVGVTALRVWLECPFRFYLARVLNLRAVDPGRNELDAADFGTLCHAALEAMGHAPALRDCTDETVLREFLLAALDAEAAKRFGREVTLPLLVQLESARQRLQRAAAVQAKTRADGWVIEQVERKFVLKIGGLEVSGKIDRIDRHERTGAVRVLDYKTSDTSRPPQAAHLRSVRREETAPGFARFFPEEKEQVWCDLQLPLYRRALAVEFPGPMSCGYFNLPKAATEADLAIWDDYTPAVAEAAWHCAEGVAAAIRAGRFWPPNEKVARDDFAALFHHGTAASVDGAIFPEVLL